MDSLPGVNIRSPSANRDHSNNPPNIANLNGERHGLGATALKPLG